jgi:hypothetical protein
MYIDLNLFSFEASPSKILNALSVISRLESLNSSNWPLWREKINMPLKLTKIDYAIDNVKHVGPMLTLEGTYNVANIKKLLLNNFFFHKPKRF